MQHERQHYGNGAWVDPPRPTLLGVVNPLTGETFTQIAVGGSTDHPRPWRHAEGPIRPEPNRVYAAAA